MCLSIRTNPALVRPTNSFIKVYKVYDYSIETGAIVVTPKHFGKSYTLRKGLTLISSRVSDRITKHEISQGEVHRGLHAWTSKEKALKHYAASRNSIVVEFLAFSDSFIARGTNEDVVYHQLEVNRIIRVNSSREVKCKYGNYSQAVKHKTVPKHIAKLFTKAPGVYQKA